MNRYELQPLPKKDQTWKGEESYGKAFEEKINKYRNLPNWDTSRKAERMRFDARQASLVAVLQQQDEIG